MKSLVKNAADPNQVREADIKEKFGRERDLDDLRFIMSTKQGRRFIWRVLSKCCIFSLSYTGEQAGTFFNEGRRDVGLPIMCDCLEADQEAYFKMSEEGKENG